MHRSSPRNPRAEANPLRSLPLFRSARSVFGSSPRDVLVGNLRKAAAFRESWIRNYAAARADLGRANRIPAENRRCAQAAAFRTLNAVCAAILANLRAIAAAEAALAAFDADPQVAVPARKPAGGPAWGVLSPANPKRVAYQASGAEAQGVPFLAWLAVLARPPTPHRRDPGHAHAQQGQGGGFRDGGGH